MSAVALLAAGFPHDALVTAITIGGSALGAAVIVPAAELGWNWLQAPMRMLHDDVQAIRERLDAVKIVSAAPSVAPEVAATVRLLSGELEESQDELHVATNTHEWWALNYLLPMCQWEDSKGELARADGDAHKATRDAYRRLAELNRVQIQRQGDAYIAPQDPRSTPRSTLSGLKRLRLMANRPGVKPPRSGVRAHEHPPKAPWLQAIRVSPKPR